jgi:hypothetical protein
MWWRCYLPLHLYKSTPLADSFNFSILSSLAWLPRLESCPRVRGNSTSRTPSRYRISGPSPSSSVALLDQSPKDVYTPYVCNPFEVPHLVVLVFIDLFVYTTLRSALVVFFDKVCAETYFPLLVFKGMNIVTAPLPYNYIE